ncbi:thermonuclease family protein [uncultured Jannaschia sp.]|uniref:thermonuclease family protein n=1 Tax=uncultured Jannaschia sp. TaxID=293347 RepID=UPI002615E91C|nr:thermonuclease family protein [uncultured Jannaschia sp.]
MLRVVAALLVALAAGVGWQLTSDQAETERPVTVYEGVPTIRDGDNVNIGGVNIRLVGIDACELGQPAWWAGAEIDCGTWARDSFRELVGPRSVRCESTERDVYDRPLAICYTGERELNPVLVRNGIAFPYARGSDYNAEAEEARTARRGIWLFEGLDEPSDYRRARRSG